MSGTQKRPQKEEKPSMECPLCGEEISEEDSACPYCGALIEEPAYDAISDEKDEEDLEEDDP